MGENIADLGGLLMALDAYHLSLHGQPAPVINGLTGDQRVFLGWAQVWRENTRDAALQQQLAVDPHSPARFAPPCPCATSRPGTTLSASSRATSSTSPRPTGR
jgi:putative endopeptidase